MVNTFDTRRHGLLIWGLSQWCMAVRLLEPVAESGKGDWNPEYSAGFRLIVENEWANAGRDSRRLLAKLSLHSAANGNRDKSVNPV